MQILYCYIKWISQHLSNISKYQNTDSILKLEQIYLTRAREEPLVEFQLVGKNLFIKKPISFLEKNSLLISAFCKTDIIKILRSAHEFYQKPKARILSYYEKNNKYMVKIDSERGCLIKSAPVAHGDINLIKNLSPFDANLLGFLAGYSLGKE